VIETVESLAIPGFDVDVNVTVSCIKSLYIHAACTDTRLYVTAVTDLVFCAI